MTLRMLTVVRTRAGGAVTFAAAIVVYAVQAIAWPLQGGRDYRDYLLYWLQIDLERPVYVNLMAFRTPLAPLSLGSALETGGSRLAEVLLALMYAGSVLAFAAAALRFGRVAARTTVVALLLYPPYGALFHGIASEPVFAFVFAVWTYFVIRTWSARRTWHFAVDGVVVFLLTMARPSSQVFLAFALAPLLLPATLRQRVAWSAVFAAVAVSLLLGWASHNAVRYDDFTVSRTAGANMPLSRVIRDRIVERRNGPASRALAAAMDRDLVGREPYSAYGVDADEALASGSPLVFSDLVALSDRIWGWDDQYSRLRDAGLEAIRAHPRAYARAVAVTLKAELTWAYRRDAPRRNPRRAAAETIVVGGRILEKPGEGQPIPASHIWWLASSPDERVVMDWASLERPVERFPRRDDARNARRLRKELDELVDELPARNGWQPFADALNLVSRIWPRPWIVILVALVAIGFRRPRSIAPLLVLSTLAALLQFVTALGQPIELGYRIPFDPLFMLTAIAAVVAPRRRRE